MMLLLQDNIIGLGKVCRTVSEYIASILTSEPLDNLAAG